MDRLTMATLCAGVAVLAACSEGETRTELSISIDAPAFTNDAAVTVRVIARDDVDAVQLSLDGLVLGELIPPYEFVWRNEGLPEGTYVFRARATRGHAVALSPPAAVVLDRTPPEVTGVTPAPGASAWTRAPVEIAFSEPIDPASVTTGVLAISGPGAGPGYYPHELSHDGLVLSTRVSVGANPPTSVNLALGSGLTDRAGNALALPAPWTLHYPEWISIPLAGGPDVDLAPLPDGLVAWASGPLGFAYALSGQPAERLALRVDGDWFTVELPTTDTYSTRIAGGPDAILLARHEYVVPIGARVHVDEVHVDFLSSLGTAPPADVGSSGGVVGTDHDGAPLVATTSGPITVARFDAGGWHVLGAPLGSISDWSWPIAFGPGGPDPVLLWGSYPLAGGAGKCHASRFDGDAWVDVGGPLPDGMDCRFAAADWAGNVLVASLDQGSLAVLRCWDGTSWTTLASVASTTAPQLAPTFGGEFWFGWSEPVVPGDVPFRFRAYRTDGSYTTLPASIDSTGLGTPFAEWIVEDTSGFPAIAWLGQLPGGRLKLYVWQKNM